MPLLGSLFFGDSQEANNAHGDDHDDDHDEDDTPPSYQQESDSLKEADDNMMGKPERAPCAFLRDTMLWVRGSTPILPDGEVLNLCKKYLTQCVLFKEKELESSKAHKEFMSAFFQFEKIMEAPSKKAYLGSFLGGFLTSYFAYSVWGNEVKTLGDCLFNGLKCAPSGIFVFWGLVTLELWLVIDAKDKASAVRDEVRDKRNAVKNEMLHLKDLVLNQVAAYLYADSVQNHIIPTELYESAKDNISKRFPLFEGIPITDEDKKTVLEIVKVRPVACAMKKCYTMEGLLNKAASSNDGESYLLDPRFVAALPPIFGNINLGDKIPGIYLGALIVSKKFNEAPLLCIEKLIDAAILYKNVSLLNWLLKVVVLPDLKANRLA